MSPKDGYKDRFSSPADKKIEVLPLEAAEKSLSKEPESPVKENDQNESTPAKVVPAKTLAKSRSQDNFSASLSSVDQMAVSSVDLDISKAVEKGVSEAKKDFSAQKDAEKSSEDVSRSSKEDRKKKSKKEKKEEKEVKRSVDGKAKDKKSKTDQKESTDEASKGIYYIIRVMKRQFVWFV